MKMENEFVYLDSKPFKIFNPNKQILSVLNITEAGIEYKILENTYELLKEYYKKYNVNGRFIRDYDKNEQLYFCNTAYTEDTEDKNWIL